MRKDLLRKVGLTMISVPIWFFVLLVIFSFLFIVCVCIVTIVVLMASKQDTYIELSDDREDVENA